VDTNVSEKHTVAIFRGEDGDGMFLRNIGISTYKSIRHCNAKTNSDIFAAVRNSNLLLLK
jgi:hypothetical protein